MFSERKLSFDDRQNQLHTACNSGTLGDVLKCLQSLKSKIQWYHEGQTPIHTAIISDRKDVCDVITALLDHGANINAKTIAEGNTALHLAVLLGQYPRHYDTVQYLLQRKVDRTIRNKTLRTAYDCAIATGQDELARVIDGSLSTEKAIELYKKRVGKTYGPFIIDAVLTSQEEDLNKYLDLGGDPNTVNKYKAGAIHYAVICSDLPVDETLVSLLQAGANPNLMNEEKETALSLAIKSEKLRESGMMKRCVQILVDAGAKPNIPNEDDKDALTLAEEKGYSDIVKILRKEMNKESYNKHSMKKKSVVFLEGNQSVDKSEPPTDVNTPNQDGLYPIHTATLLNDPARRLTRINMLITKGAEVNRQIETTGNTALHLCAANDYGEAASVLLDNRIDYTVKNKNGQTAYDVARDMGNESVVSAIKKKQELSTPRKKSKSCVIL